MFKKREIERGDFKKGCYFLSRGNSLRAIMSMFWNNEKKTGRRMLHFDSAGVSESS